VRAGHRQKRLRYLKLEAKRRLAAGEFSALHEAHLAIAREHGMPNWVALKRSCELGQEGHAVPQIKWVTSRFADADDPAWTPPAESELREHFADAFLGKIPPDKLVPLLVHRVAGVREDLTMLITSTAVLRLVAGGRLGLDDPVNRHLRTIRLAHDIVTVSELLMHAGGVDGCPAPFTDRVRDLATLFGPVISGSGERGVARLSDGGYGALGQLIADITGQAYPDAARRC
jgi:Beta-lactamase